MYIVVFRSDYKDPFVLTNEHGFKEIFNTYEDAQGAAEAALDNEWFNNYAIFKAAFY